MVSIATQEQFPPLSPANTNHTLSFAEKHERLRRYQNQRSKHEKTLSDAREQLERFERSIYGTSKERETHLTHLKSAITKGEKLLAIIDEKIKKHSGQKAATPTHSLDAPSPLASSSPAKAFTFK